ncbi:agmatinase [uncultured Sneathiella sp.]|uniref:agmatinase n=1 Tax=uncultured Sneathiella sp. TaxID=879315 RepID=UPI0030EE2047|tara:strand:+ start:523 stop:1422 length:900 start_codon:yes stop_codon:yes gene_type:complete
MTVPFDILPSEEGFLGLPEEEAVDYASAKAIIIPFGLEGSVSYGGGTALGPAAMIEASHQVELFDEDLWREPFRDFGVVTMREKPVDGNDIKAAIDDLAALTEAALGDSKFPLVFGGEHSITPGAIRPFLAQFDDLAILHFDAHADLRDGYDGEHYSHAAAIRRVLDHPTVPIVSVGIRNISAEEIPFLDANRHRINIHWGKDRESWQVDDIVAPLKGRPIYLTFDLDGFDGSVMPATGTPEPGGLFWNDAIKIIKAASGVGTIVGADINELAPIEGMHAPNFLAAKLAYKILSLALSK